MATHFSILAWRILWTKRSLVGYSSSGNKESDTTEHTHDCMKFFFFLNTFQILFLSWSSSDGSNVTMR